jgi:hypothetical protein
MSLPAGERRKLRAIERAQATADPDLAARFFLFSQLSWYEEMPRTERLNARAIRRRKRAERAIIAYFISGPDLLLRAGLPRARYSARGQFSPSRPARRQPAGLWPWARLNAALKAKAFS